MAGMNTVVLLGNLTRDPELRYTPQGAPVCSFTIAVNERSRAKDGEERVAFVDVETWGRAGETAALHLKKGRQVIVLGSLRQDRWIDEATKKPRARLYVVAGQVQFLGGKSHESAELQAVVATLEE